MNIHCRICSEASEPIEHRTREMMYGTREEFDYTECTACGSVQIATVPTPDELARFYPTDYYSFAAYTPNPVKRFLMNQRDRHLVGLPNIGGRRLAAHRTDPVLAVLAKAGLDRKQRILDVGCGSAWLLEQLHRLGFRQLTGTDPFIGADSTTKRGVPILKRYLDEVEGTFDIIMFNHALEHVADPLGELVAARDRLAPGGSVLVRLPTTSSEAWEHYGVNWIQLDPPRHLAVPSRAGMEKLAQQAGLAVVRTIDDSSAFQFVGSELYLRDIPVTAPEASDVFTPDEVAQYEARSVELNEQGRGDQALFVLSLPNA
jgi:SAM-dependent methyltransferase